MVPLTSLWAPILVSGVAVFLASFILHMVLPYHRSDYGHVPTEDAVMDGLRKAAIPPGDYFLPHAGSPAAMKNPEYKAKLEKGPLVVMTVLKPGAYAMGPRLVQWFLYTLVVSGLAGFLASHSAGPMASSRRVFHFAATVAFASYALGLWQDSIWYSRKWSTTIKNTFDSLIYAALTGAVFVWLWPR
jgi:hypothetical protein